MRPRIEISGGAEADVAAAIAAVVSQILTEEAAVRATPTIKAEQSAWVRAGRLRRAPSMVGDGVDPPAGVTW